MILTGSYIDTGNRWLELYEAIIVVKENKPEDEETRRA